jgi:hypothetical protein
MNLASVVRNLRLYGKAERLLLQAQAGQVARRGASLVFALLFAGIGLVFLNVALFAWLTALWGPVWAPAILGGVNLLLAGLAALLAQAARPSAEVQLAEQVRDLAAGEVERELSSGPLLQGVTSLAGGGDGTLRLILPVLTTLVAALGKRKAAAGKP